jgi:hypothetical protein
MSLASVEIPSVVGQALLTCVDAMREYIVPDGISDDEFANRIIGALDNDQINPFIFELERVTQAIRGDAT